MTVATNFVQQQQSNEEEEKSDELEKLIMSAARINAKRVRVNSGRQKSGPNAHHRFYDKPSKIKFWMAYYDEQNEHKKVVATHVHHNDTTVR